MQPAIQIRTLFDSPVLKASQVRLPPGSREWVNPGTTQSAPEIAFPHLPVINVVDGHGPVLRDSTSANFNNAETRFYRKQVHPRGVLTDWFALPPTVWQDLLAPVDPVQAEKMGTPFRYPQGRLPASALQRQRTLFAYLESTPASNVDRVFVEETALSIVQESLQAAYANSTTRRSSVRRSSTRKAHEDAVQRALEFMASRLHEPLSLEQIGRAAMLSPFHFTRVFRRQTGMTIHAHLTDLRVRAAYDAICIEGKDLSEAALDAGFSNRSHLSRTFSSRFGLSPADARRLFKDPSPSKLRKLVRFSPIPPGLPDAFR